MTRKRNNARASGIIDPDGIPMRIDFHNLREGYSVFIPCLNTLTAKKQVLYIADKMDLPVQCQTTIANGRYGLRVWYMQ